MKMKKVLSLALALMLAIGVLAGCGGDGGSYSTTADIEKFKVADEKIEISWLGYANLAGCEEGTASELLLEEKFNVELKPIFAESSNYQDKKSALLQSGDIPDLVYELDPAHVYKDAEDEFLFEVPYEAIKKYAPSLYADINEKAKAVWSYSYYDGANYGLPNVNHAHVESRVPAYRGDWLKKLGMETPTSVEELHDVLYAFVHEDPDGNGKDDTYGYAFASAHFQHYFGEIFGAYGVLPFDWQEVDGEIVYGGLRPECETVLATLNQWWNEGLIYPAYAEGDVTAAKLFTSGQVGYVHHMGYDDPSLETSNLNTTKAVHPEAEILYADHIKGPNGDYGLRGWGYPCHVVAFGANDAEETPVKVATILNMFETMYNDDALLKEVRLGKEGEQYTVDTESTGVNSFVPTEAYAEAAQRRLAGYEFGLGGPTFWTPFAPKYELYQSGLSTPYKEWGSEYLDQKAVLTDVFYKVDIVPSATTYIETLRNEQIKLMNNIIMGSGSVKADQYIEEFTNIWNANGGPQMLDEAKAQQATNEEIFAMLP